MEELFVGIAAHRITGARIVLIHFSVYYLVQRKQNGQERARCVRAKGELYPLGVFNSDFSTG